MRYASYALIFGMGDPGAAERALTEASTILLVIAAVIGVALYVYYRKAQESNEMAEEIMAECLENERRKSGF